MIAFRVDANSTVAMGHVMRCISIADEAFMKKIPCIFITADNYSGDIIEKKGYKVVNLNTNWAVLEDEIDILSKVITEYNIGILFVDSYYVTAKYMDALSKVTKLVYIDDLAKEPYSCYALINYNCYAHQMQYSSLYDNTNTTLLLGTKYVPLRQEFLQLRTFKCKPNVKSILITTGGADQLNLSGKITKELLSITQNSLCIHIVLGNFNNNHKELLKLQEVHPNIFLHRNVENMCDLMRNCDMAISTAGFTLYELCACGIPTVMFAVADNQLFACNEISNLNIMLGGKSIFDGVENCVSYTVEEAEKLIFNYQIRSDVSKKMSRFMARNGAYNILEGIGCL